MIGYWNHLIAMDNQRLTKIVFSNDYHLKRGNWSKEISQLFHKLDVNSVFTDMNEWLLNITRDKLHILSHLSHLEYDMNKKKQTTNFQTFKTGKLHNDIYKYDFAEI